MTRISARNTVLVLLACLWLLPAGAVAFDLKLPLDQRLTGRWSAADQSEQGRLEAKLTPVGEGEYELWFKVTGSPVFNPSGKPYPDEGFYPVWLERAGDDGLSFTYRTPFPRVPALFFVPNRFTYRVRLEGTVDTINGRTWKAAVRDHNLALTFWVHPRRIVGTYNYDGRWAKAVGSFRMVVNPERGSSEER
jgi:hypothetical protein